MMQWGGLNQVCYLLSFILVCVCLCVLIFVWCVRAELMLLGFMSLLLAVTQQYIAKICVSSKVADTMLPCRKEAVIAETESLAAYRHLVNGVSTADWTRLNYNLNLRSLYSRRLGDDEVETAKNANATDSCSSRVCSMYTLFYVEMQLCVNCGDTLI